jgi:peptidoglycan/LPS O-acetylase OafA/YrhL
VAAAVVVVAHSFDAVAMPRAVRAALLQSPLAPLLSSQGAVQLFFVLSGLVLAASLERSRERPPWPQFYLRRIFRIHPPYLFGVLFAWCLSFFFLPWEPGGGITRALAQAMRVHLEPSALAGTFLFPGAAAGQLPVGWTLRVEMIYSFLLPLLVLAARPARGLPLLLGCAALLLLPKGFALGWYAIDFALGVVAWQERAALAAWFPRRGEARAALVVAALALLSAPQLLGWWRPVAGVLVGGFFPKEIAVMAAGAFLLVTGAVAMPGVGYVLSRGPLLFLGRISFSLYLVHGPLLALLAPRIVSAPDPGNGLRVLAVVLPLSIAVAALSFSLVERPSIALGNRLCRQLARRLGRRPLESHAGEVAP